jgi:hypothetical protein
VQLDFEESGVIAGSTVSPDFPTTPGAFDTNPSAVQGKAFLLKMDLLPTGVESYGESTAGCHGKLAAGVISMPKIGNSAFALTCTNTPPSSMGWLLVGGTALDPPLAAAGAQLFIDPAGYLALAPATSDPAGFVELPVLLSAAVPPGVQAYLQYFFPDPCAPGGVSASNALHVTVQP